MNLENSRILYISLTNTAGGAEQILLMCSKITGGPVIFLKKTSRSPLSIGESAQVRFLSRRSIFIGSLLLIKELIPFRRNYLILSSHPYLNAYLGILKRLGFLRSQLVTRECTSVFLRFSGIKRFTYKFVYTLGYSAIDLLICQTPEMKAQLLQNIQFLKDDQVKVLKNPIDLPSIISHSEQEELDPIMNERFICSAGRLISLKGFDNLISVFWEISKLDPDLKLLILGEGEQRHNLQQIIERLGLYDKVVLKGFVSNPFPYFKKAQVCVVSSIREGFPNVLLQMMALNQSVVSTLCADGIEEFNFIKKVAVGDLDGLKDAIISEIKLLKQSTTNKNFDLLMDRSPRAFLNQILRSI